MNPIQPHTFFTDFYNHELQHVNAHSSWLLVSTSSGITLERKEGLSIWKFCKQLFGTSYDLEQNAKTVLSIATNSQLPRTQYEIECAIKTCKSVSLWLEHKAKTKPSDSIDQLRRNFTVIALPVLEQQKQNFELEKAILERDAHKVKSLLNGPIDLSWTNPTSSYSHLHLATNLGDIEVSSLLLEKGADIHSVDAAGNTPLHLACKNYHAEMAWFLIRHRASVTKVNHNDKTALQSIENDNSKCANIFYSIFFTHSPTVAKKIQDSGIKKFLEEMHTEPKKFLPDCKAILPLEIAFLFNDKPLTHALMAYHTRDDFFKTIRVLKEKYPTSTCSLLYSCDIRLQYKQLALPLFKQEIPPPRKRVELDTLISQLDSLDFHKINPNDFVSKRIVTQQLNEFILRIKKRTPFAGTPIKNSPAIEQFYQTLENIISNVLIHFEEIPTHDDVRIDFIREILLISEECGERYLTSLTMKYFEICRNEKHSFEDKILDSLGVYRQLLVMALLDNKDHNTNEYNAFIRQRGEALGIPGSLAIKKIPNRLGHSRVAEKEAAFLKLYTIENCQKEWVGPLLATNGAFREAYIDWHTARLPKEWSDKKRHTYLEKWIYEKDGSLNALAINYFLVNMKNSHFSSSFLHSTYLP